MLGKNSKIINGVQDVFSCEENVQIYFRFLLGSLGEGSGANKLIYWQSDPDTKCIKRILETLFFQYI